MRNYSTILFLMILSVCSNALAVEPVTEQQVMLYYSIPLGGDNPQNKAHKFGLRVDQTTHAPGEIAEFGSLMKKPATFDLQAGHERAYTLKIHGVDYTEKLVVHRADAEESVEADIEASEEAGTEAEAATEEAGTETEVAPEAATGTETEAGAEAGVDTEAGADTEAATGKAEATEEAPPAEDTRNIVQKKLDELPFGVIIGVLLGIGIIAGVGG